MGEIPTSGMPEILTEDEAARKVSMMKAASEVAEAVDEMKRNLENRGWSTAEQAALMLFNTMLMTAFGEQVKNNVEDTKKRAATERERIKERSLELAIKRGFAHKNDGAASDVVQTCVHMLLDGQEQRAGAVWEDFFGEGTAGVLHSILIKARAEVASEGKAE